MKQRNGLAPLRCARTLQVASQQASKKKERNQKKTTNTKKCGKTKKKMNAENEPNDLELFRKNHEKDPTICITNHPEP